MVKLLGACSPILLAATMAAAVAEGQTPAAGQPQPQVTAVGCVTRNGTTDVDKGLRLLNMEPNGLALTSARVIGDGRNRATGVPGSLPEGSNSGTIPQGTIVGGPNEQQETLTLALTGTQVNALGEHVGRRVEVVGRLTPASATGTAQPRGTTGTARDSEPVNGAGTRQERAGEGSAHPSTELPRLDVVSFRSATGACE